MSNEHLNKNGLMLFDLISAESGINSNLQTDHCDMTKSSCK